MDKKTLIKVLAGVILVFTGLTSLSAADRYSVASGNWNANSTWSATSGGAPGASFPVAGDVVYLNSNFTVTLTANAACSSLSFLVSANGATLSIGAYTLTVSGAVTFSAPNANNGDQTINITTGTLDCASVYMPNTSNDNRDLLISITSGTINCSGNIRMDGTNARNNITVSGAGNINVGGDFTGGGFTAGTGTVNYNGLGNQSIGAYTYNNLTISGSDTKSLSGAAIVGGTYSNSDAAITLACGNNNLTFNGTVTNAGILTVGNNTVTYGGGGAQTIIPIDYYNLTTTGARGGNSITFSGNIGIGNAFSPGATFGAGSNIVTGSTFDFFADLAQNVPGFTYNNLIISNNNSASSTARTKTQTGAIVVNGDLTVSGLSAALTTFQLGAFNFTVTGSTFVNDYGILADATANTNLFTGKVTIATFGRWNVTVATTFRGGIENNSTSFTATGATYTFNTNNQSLTGIQAVPIPNIVVTGVILTNELTAGLTVSGTVSGTGGFTNGSMGNAAILVLTGTGNPLTFTGASDFTTYENTVNFNSTGAQTIAARNFYNLTVSGARAGNSVTFANGGAVGISAAFAPIATFGAGNYVFTNNTLNFNGSSAQNIPAAGTANYNNITVSGGGAKTLVGNITLAATGVFNLNGAVTDLAGFNLTVLNTAAGGINQGSPYNSTNMISTSGIGYLEKRGAASAGFQITYPVGSGGYYSPLIITSIGSVTPAWLRVRAVPTAINPSYILKYWDVTASVALNNVTATFQYDPAEANGASSSISYSPNSGTTWQNPPSSGVSSFGANSFTITGTNPFNGWWTMGYRTYYSYQTGLWNSFSTWTSDPSGTLQLGNTVPGVNDLVVILEGRTVSLSADVSSATIDLTINEGAFLNMSTFGFTSGLQALRGNGTLQLSSASFPSAATNTFVAAGGGTSEYQASVNLPAGQATYNNLKINSSGTVILVSNVTLNGNLEIAQGTFQINDNTATRRQLTINGNVTVNPGASFITGNGVTNSTTNPVGIATALAAPFINYYDSHSHRVVIMGDFTNNGTVRFTNLAYPLYNAFPPTVLGATSGFATVYFMGTSNNTLTCNGQTDFYNLVLDKGTDRSYSLTVYSSDYQNFRLFGANISGGDVTAPATAANPNLKKALWIRTGTLILDGSVVIPSLSEGNDAAAPALNFIIPSNGALVLNNADVIVLSTADRYEEVNAAYGISGGSGTVNGVTGAPNESGILVYGRLEINNGYLSMRESLGLLYSSVVSGEINIAGGTVDAKQFRSLNAGTGLVSYSQSGGTVELRGRFQRIPTSYSDPGDLSAAPVNTVRLNDAALLTTAGSFSIENTSDIFNMTGGTVRIYDVPVSGATGRAYDILTSQANYNVTGGSVVFSPDAGTGGSADTPAWLVTSSAQVGSVTVNSTGSTSTVQVNTGYPLTVLGNLSVISGSLNANSLDVTVGGDLNISSGTTFTTGSNTLIFNGSGDQAMSVDLAAPLTLNNLRVDKTSGTELLFTGSQGTLNVAGSFTLNSGSVDDGGTTVNIAGNVYNAGTHTGSGRLVLNGTALQSIDGNGLGIFGNLELNNTNAASSPVSLASNTAVLGSLILSQDKLLNIATYSLRLGPTASISGSSSSRYIKTSGALGDGGLIKEYSSSTPDFVFPVGVTAFTPASLSINGTASTYGSITVVPVSYAHPNATVSGRSLSYFWRISSTGFTLGSATVTQGYTYSQTNVVTGAGITEDEYVAARYNPSTYTWTRGTSADVDETSNIIGEPGTGSFLDGVAFIDGDYTAGDDNATNPFGTPVKFYSRQTGTWGTAATWSLTSHTVTNPPASPPGAGDIVIIGNGHTVTFGTPANYLTSPNTDPRSCASLQIEAGSTLDIRFNPASVFSMVQSHPSGNGTFRIAADYDDGSTFQFPAGDFSEFNQNLGTTELYSTNGTSGTTYWLPNGISSYGNLIISPLGGSNIIFPNNNLTVLGDLIMKGQNADSWFCPTWSGNYPTAPNARVAKTITVNGDFDIRGGSFGWYGNNGGGAQNIVINGDVIVAPGAGIDVWSPNTSQSMAIGGSLINNSTNAIAGGTSTRSYVNLTQVPLTLFGNTNASLTNTAGTPRTDLGQVIVNKGTSQATTFTLDIGNTLNTLTNGWLTLQNGTFRYMRTNPAAGANFTISTTSQFSIPATAGLYIDYANANNISVQIGNAANNNGDILLSGKLTVVRGILTVGQVAAPDNNNDIEYSGSGSSEIDIQGGTVTVNGTIRRAGTSAGSLKYSQSGSSAVTINGRGGIGTNGKIEVLNAGSSFNMSGTSTLTVLRGGATGSFGDIYLRPENSTVTGGTIILQTVTGITAAEETFKIDASVPLNNLTVTGFGATDAARAVLNVNPLVLTGNLTISNANSFFTSSNLNLTVGGNLSNSGTYSFGTNTTTFNGNTQSVLGTTVTNFYNLNVSPVNSLTVSASFAVAGNLEIGSGTLILGNRRLTLSGNIINNGSYSDDNTTGGVLLQGSSLQSVSGDGSFGRLELNNAQGARTLSDISFQNNLVLTLGRLDINANQLTLGTLSQITGAPFTLNNMIVCDGVASSLGVKKFFPVIAAPVNFTFPLGVSGKYTPATFTINTNSSVGFINVKPVNIHHPSAVDPSNALDYYWEIESSGISGFNGSLNLKYLTSDARGAEADYVAARLLVPTTSWSKATPGPATDNVDETNQLIAFSYPAGTNSLNGDYTAGTDAAIPDEVPVYVSVSDGDWSDENIWAPVGAAPPCPVGGPNGFVVIIDHDVIADVDYTFAYKTTINGTLSIPGATYGHNMGLVDGAGRLIMESGNLPAGNFTSFLNCTGGELEYSGTGNYSIIANQYSSVKSLFFSGSGLRVLPNKNLTVCNRLVIDGPVLDNSVNNRSLIIRGTLERYNTGEFRAGTGANATVSFQGTALQNLGGALGSFTGTNKFNNLEINNSAGVTVGNGINEIGGNLLLTNGIFNTSATNRLFISNIVSACVLPSGGSSTSFINGPLTKNIPSGLSFVFPIGTGTTKGHTFTATAGAGATVAWTATYNMPNSTSGSFTAPLQSVNAGEFWSLSSGAARTAYVKMAWDTYSDLTPLMTPNGLSDMRASEYSAGSWQALNTTATGNNDAGDVASTNTVNITVAPKNYTIAAVRPTIPRASLEPTGPVCGTAGIPVAFASATAIPLNYTLSYTVNGIAQTPVTVTSVPYTLPTPVAGNYVLTAFTYNNGLNNGVVDPSTVTVFANPTASAAGTDQSLCGVSGTTLAGNDPAPYSGLWTIVSGSGGTFLNSTLYNTDFIGNLGETYTLRWTISNGSCTSSDDVVVSFPVVAARPGSFIAAVTPVCQNTSGHVYTVPLAGGVTYNWTYSGTDYTISGTGNSVTVDFGPAATSGTLSVTATNSCGTSPARTVDITVTPTPVATFSYLGSPYCPNDSDPSAQLDPGSSAGVFSSTAGLVFLNTSTGLVDLSASLPGTYTVTNTIAAAGGCSLVSATSDITISDEQTWTGASDNDWNNPMNWSCGYIPTLITTVIIPSVGNQPSVTSGSPAYVYDLVINAGATLAVSGNSISIAGSVSNGGSFDLTDGTVVFNGTSPQTIAPGTFSGNLVKNLTVDNATGVSLSSTVEVTGIVLVQSGVLASGGNLTLASDASGTALIDGAGAGEVTGNVTMQRYLSSRFGYKYLSSPFVAAAVNELSDEINLAASFPPVYKYDENRISSGWVNYSNGANIMNPLSGYSVNFGNTAVALTADITGVVNNGALSVTLYNHNYTYTKGFNLVGNPYPSPIDWDAASGWTRTNIDDAVYYFRSSAIDQYGGTYSSYVNGVSSDGVADNIIPSMQGFFVHVSDGGYPVTGTFSMNNSVRIANTVKPLLKSSAKGKGRSLLRLNLLYAADTTAKDPLLIYIDDKATDTYDPYLDALKLLNTDLGVPNIYAMSPENHKMSISSLPNDYKESIQIPLGIKTNRNGDVIFRLKDLVGQFAEKKVTLYDAVTNTETSLLNKGEYRLYLPKAEYHNRFWLNVVSVITDNGDEPFADKGAFKAWYSDGTLRLDIPEIIKTPAVLRITNLSGKDLKSFKVNSGGYSEYPMEIVNGMYLISLTSGGMTETRKIIISEQ